MAEHAGVDQLIQHADGQGGDVLGTQIIQNEQIGFLAGFQPAVLAVPVKMFPAQLGSQSGAAGV